MILDASPVYACESAPPRSSPVGGQPMSSAVIVRYQTRPDAAEENQRLVEQVYAELARDDPGGFRYATFRLADGVTFVHIGIVEGEVSPLPQVAAFQEFQRGIRDRCVVQPEPASATLVGSYRLPAGQALGAPVGD